MVNLIHINDNFNKGKSFIIDMLIDYYGNEYSDIIKWKVKHHMKRYFHLQRIF